MSEAEFIGMLVLALSAIFGLFVVVYKPLKSNTEAMTTLTLRLDYLIDRMDKQEKEHKEHLRDFEKYKEKEWQEYKEKVDKMWEKFTESGEITPEPEPEEPDGSKDKPFPATNNMQYYNGKYYTYNDVLYLCNRDTEQAVWHTPDQLVGIYFQIVPTEEE